MAQESQEAKPQVLAPMDAIKLILVSIYYVYQDKSDPFCSLNSWLFTLWVIFLLELGLKLFIKTCTGQVPIIMSTLWIILGGETLWHFYGCFLLYSLQGTCKFEVDLGTKVALGLFMLSNVSAALLALCGIAKKTHRD